MRKKIGCKIFESLNFAHMLWTTQISHDEKLFYDSIKNFNDFSIIFNDINRKIIKL